MATGPVAEFHAVERYFDQKGQRPDSYQPGATPQVGGIPMMGGLKARPMDYRAGLQPLILCAPIPGALPQAGINRAFGAGCVGDQSSCDFQSRLEPAGFSR